MSTIVDILYEINNKNMRAVGSDIWCCLKVELCKSLTLKKKL